MHLKNPNQNSNVSHFWSGTTGGRHGLRISPSCSKFTFLLYPNVQTAMYVHRYYQIIGTLSHTESDTHSATTLMIPFTDQATKLQFKEDRIRIVSLVCKRYYNMCIVWQIKLVEQCLLFIEVSYYIFYTRYLN